MTFYSLQTPANAKPPWDSIALARFYSSVRIFSRAEKQKAHPCGWAFAERKAFGQCADGLRTLSSSAV
jgi:hypothetical protein